MQPARGTVHTVGRMVLNYDAGIMNCTEHVTGIFIEMSDEQVRLAGAMLRATVEVWPACADDLAPGECTPENYAHLKHRLAAAADNLAREVRSNEAAALVRGRLENDCAMLADDRDRLVADLAEALGEAAALREAFGVPTPEYLMAKD